jgi:hypothetical protein
LKKRLMKFRKFTREESQSIQYILDLLRSESTNCSYLYTKDQERDTWMNTWRGEICGKGRWIDTWQGEGEWICCKHENEGELNHSPRYGIEDEERGSQGQSEVEVWGEGGVFR